MQTSCIVYVSMHIRQIFANGDLVFLNSMTAVTVELRCYGKKHMHWADMNRVCFKLKQWVAYFQK